MVSVKSLDEFNLIAAALHDVSVTHGAVFNYSNLNKTIKVVKRRLALEGLGFLTKTLPRLGKAFDKALSGDTPLNASECRFSPAKGSKLPRFLGELFSEVLQTDGTLLPLPCPSAVAALRGLLYLFYKYEVPYATELNEQVIIKFKRTEDDLKAVVESLKTLRDSVDNLPTSSRSDITSLEGVVRVARRRLSRLFAGFDPKDIKPRHGPGAVATKQRLWDKFRWTNVSARITDKYPFDAYFCASLGHVCDRYDTFDRIGNQDLPARVILVPKDSRGPRLISCEPVDFQWIQQGLGRAIVELVERHPLTKWNVHFSDQQPNQFGALLGSSTGKYATLDLNEASDRVSVELVRLLFPSHICEYLEACRSSATVLPNGEVLPLLKFAPMGSALCFPILALTIWAILTAATCDRNTRESILVYGDDVIVPTAHAGDAMNILESFGLKINRDKSCTRGLFRESCGMDAFNGIQVTPVRIRTPWSTSQSPESYTSWIAYANSFYDRKYFKTYDLIVGALVELYRHVPSDDMQLLCPALREAPITQAPFKSRYSRRFQKKQWLVRDVKAPTVNHVSDGWEMLLRYFSEAPSLPPDQTEWRPDVADKHREAFSVSSYTRRGTSMLVRRWR